MTPGLKIKSVLGIVNAEKITADGGSIAMTVQTDVGDLPFLYVRGDHEPLTIMVMNYLAAHPDLPVATFRPPKAPDKKPARKPKGGDDD